MAYQATITKVSVAQQGTNLYDITMKMIVNDGVSDIFTTTANARYNSAVGNLNDSKTQILNDLKAKWDKFKAEYILYSAASMNNAVTDIQTQANTYINL